MIGYWLFERRIPAYIACSAYFLPQGRADNSPGRQSGEIWRSKQISSPVGTTDKSPVSADYLSFLWNSKFESSSSSPRTGVLGYYRSSLRDEIKPYHLITLSPSHLVTAPLFTLRFSFFIKFGYICPTIQISIFNFQLSILCP
jgi:hypothetical protein